MTSAQLQDLDCHVILGNTYHLYLRPGDELIARLGEMADGGAVTCDLRVPQREGALLASIHRLGRILHTEYEGDAVRLTAVLPARLAESCAPFVVGGAGKPGRPLEPWEKS